MLPGLAATSAGRQPCPRDYQLRRTLGEGSFGIVKLALHVPSRTEVAVKIDPAGPHARETARRRERQSPPQTLDAGSSGPRACVSGGKEHGDSKVPRRPGREGREGTALGEEDAQSQMPRKEAKATKMSLGRARHE